MRPPYNISHIGHERTGTPERLEEENPMKATWIGYKGESGLSAGQSILRKLLSLTAILLVVMGMTMPQAVDAQEERLLTTPTPWWYYHGVSADQLMQFVSNNQGRLIDIEVEQVSPLRFTGVMVKNAGVYAKSWWWYYGLTLSQLQSKLPYKRILDLETYFVDGQQRYAVILVPNTGTQAKAWWYYINVSLSSLMSKASANNARIIDLESYVINGTRYYSAVMISNTGADAKSWWIYVNVTPTYLSQVMPGKQLIDIERHGTDTFSAVMVQKTSSYWWWYYGVNPIPLPGRIVHAVPYFINGQKRFAAIEVKNN
jgi:hypothetical protein